MILYLDTSAWVKLYVRELHSELARRWVDQATVIATAELTYVEARSSLARRWREGALDGSAYEGALAAVDGDWPRLVALTLDRVEAGQMVDRHRLKALDAVHVAAATRLARRLAPEPVFFASFDVRQREAAALEGLQLLQP